MKNNHLRTIAWLALAVLVTLTAVWQAQVTVAREVVVRNQLPQPPQRTRHAVRDTTPASPVIDYATQKSQGLTDRHIGWIIEDLQTAGLDLGIRAASQQEYLAQRQAQDRWYRDALVEAWSANPEQSVELEAKLDKLYEVAKADFTAAFADIKPIEIDGKKYMITSADPIHRLIDVNRRLNMTSPYTPWKLAEFLENASGNPDLQSEIIQPFPVFSSDLYLPVVDHLLPRHAPAPGGESVPGIHQETEIIPWLRTLHPAQLKLQLLLAPHRAKEIQAVLEETQPIGENR